MKTAYAYLNSILTSNREVRIPGQLHRRRFESAQSSHASVAIQSSQGFEFDQTYRYVSALPAQLVSGYSTADLHFAWAATRQMEFSIVGQNLFQPQHTEFGRDPGPLVGIKRSVYAQITWRRSAD